MTFTLPSIHSKQARTQVSHDIPLTLGDKPERLAGYGGIFSKKLPQQHPPAQMSGRQKQAHRVWGPESLPPETQGPL